MTDKQVYKIVNNGNVVMMYVTYLRTLEEMLVHIRQKTVMPYYSVLRNGVLIYSHKP